MTDKNTTLNNSDNIFKKIISEAASLFQPVSGTFELTSRCNLRCGMCYVKEECEHSQPCHKELSVENWLDLARSATESGMIFLLLTGGEPFLRKDFFDIYTPMTKLGLQISIFTNGTLITEKIAEKLAELPPSRIEISLYGATKETYETVTGVSGSYEKCLSGINYLIKAGLPSVVLKTTLSKFNAFELHQMTELAHSMNLPLMKGWILHQHQNKYNEKLCEYRLSPEEGTTLDKEIIDGSLDRYKWTPGKQHEGRSFRCNAGMSNFYITSEGKMIPCSIMTQLYTEPLLNGFANAWEELKIKTSAIPNSKTCNNSACSFYDYCSWCPAGAYLEKGSYTELIPYHCKIAQIRKDRV